MADPIVGYGDSTMKWWKRGGEHERAMAVAALAPRVLIVITIASFVNLFMAYQSYTALTTKDSQLLEDAREVVYFDEVLTMSARLAALTGETRWKTRYAESEPNLDAAIQRILQSAPEQAQEAFERTKQANDGLVALEHEAQKLEEPALLFGDRYENLKSIYSTGVQKLLDQVRESSNQRRETTERNVAIGYWLSLGSLTTLIWLSFIQRRLERDDERLRRELIVIARRHTVDRLAASLAHELTQPLGAATLYAEAADAAVQKGETETAQEAIKGSLNSAGAPVTWWL